MDNSVNDGSGSNFNAANGQFSQAPENVPATGLVSAPGAGALFADQTASTQGATPTQGPALVRDGATVPIATPTDNPDYITLSDGSVAHVKAGKGKHLMEAQERADGNGPLLTAIMVTLTTTIDGKPFVVEDFKELPLKDAYAIMARFNEKNVF